jgi:hypothetical protein
LWITERPPNILEASFLANQYTEDANIIIRIQNGNILNTDIILPVGKIQTAFQLTNMKYYDFAIRLLDRDMDLA